MNQPTFLSPQVVLASYTPQRQQRYTGNELICALPPALSEEEIVESLQFLPPFDESSRSWPRHERMRELLSLVNLMVPLASHIELALTLDSMMREGYVGRRPMTAQHIAIYQQIHEDSLAAKGFRQTYDTVAPKLSSALIGVSGMGKTTTVQRCLARYPRVIYHPRLDLYQIPWLHFEMPKDSKGVKALLVAIIEAIAELIPDNTYIEDYVTKGRPTDAMLQSSVRILLNKHCVGLLIPDEIQNAANNRGQSDEVVMTELTTLANKSKTPVLYIGTPKAKKVLGLDMRQARRSLGLGLGDWSALPRLDLAENEESGELQEVPGQWVYFMQSLWQYCWMSEPQPLTDELLDAFYYCTQGILDLAIKMFITLQARAILDDTPTLSTQLVMSVFNDCFELVHPIVEALRNDDQVSLMKFEDVKSLSIEDTLEALERRRRPNSMRAASSRPGSPDFKVRLLGAAKAMGLPPEDAAAITDKIAKDGSAKNMFDAVVQLARTAAPVKGAKKAGRAKTAKVEAGPVKGRAAAALDQSNTQIELQPQDMRRAIALATAKNTSVVEQLFALEFVQEPEESLWAV